MSLEDRVSTLELQMAALMETHVAKTSPIRVKSESLCKFVEERCGPDPKSIIPATEFWDRYISWSGKAITRKQIAHQLRDLGYKVAAGWYSPKMQTVRCVIGLRWREPE